MKRCSYLAWWLWLEIKRLQEVDHCPDGPWCGCDQHCGDGGEIDD